MRKFFFFFFLSMSVLVFLTGQYEYGNDNLMGKVAEPGKLMLSGLGLLSIGIFLRRNIIKQDG